MNRIRSQFLLKQKPPKHEVAAVKVEPNLAPLRRSCSSASTLNFLGQPFLRRTPNGLNRSPLVRHLYCPASDGASPRTSTSESESSETTAVESVNEIEFGFAKGEPKVVSTLPARRPPSTIPDDESEDDDPYFYDRVLQDFPTTPTFLPSAPGLSDGPRRQPVLRRATTVTSFSYPTHLAYPVDSEQKEDVHVTPTPQPRRKRRWLGGLRRKSDGPQKLAQS